jgi:hypothetical protein
MLSSQIMPNNYISSVTLYSAAPYTNFWALSCGQKVNKDLKSGGEQQKITA